MLTVTDVRTVLCGGAGTHRFVNVLGAVIIVCVSVSKLCQKSVLYELEEITRFYVLCGAREKKIIR